MSNNGNSHVNIQKNTKWLSFKRKDAILLVVFRMVKIKEFLKA